MQEIRLRVLCFPRENIFRLICLETDIAVEGNTIKEAKDKMGDALTLYLTSFTDDELNSWAFIRKAPIQYSFFWHIGSFASTISKMRNHLSSLKAIYNPKSTNLSFA
jgi:hypothetical protein